ncbi:MAG: 6-carboxytetrahydropterin synthase [Cyanobacteria bacterium HKST-UBA06]|nr:6-carboxytetrahydropterin synthase [Cyanobacteria bacterium HKST-UBA06]
MTTRLNETFGVRIYKEYFNFACAHFLIFDDGTREELHGHNYQATFQIEGDIGPDSDLFMDFLLIKPMVKAVCDSLDHRTIFPQFNAHLEIGVLDEAHYRVVYQGRDVYTVPKRDTLILPIPNTSSERLAEYLCKQTLRAMVAQYPQARITFVEFSVEESRGQAALYRQHYAQARPLCELVALLDQVPQDKLVTA